MLNNKKDVFEQFKDWKTLVETQTSKKLKRLRTDNGLEFCNKMFEDFCSKHGIVKIQNNKTYTPIEWFS